MTVIKIENLWKEYQLGVIGHGTLTHDLQSWWARLRGEEDPNSKFSMLDGQEKQIDGDQFWALRNINLEVKEGEVLGIIGKNGAGKSTLLKILSRVTAPTKGNIKIKGRIASLLEVGTGFHPELTGRENIFMNGAILGMSKKKTTSKLDEIIDFSGIETFIDTPVKRYSSGMYVRLAFAVAAHLEPEILVVDEVLAVGDIDFQKKCLSKIENVSKEGRTILIVSHNMALMNSLCSSAILLRNGSVKDRGKANKVVQNYIKSSVKGLGLGIVPKNISTINTGIICIEYIDIKNESYQSTQKICFKELFRVVLLVNSKEQINNTLVDIRFSSLDGIEIVHAMNTYDLSEKTDLHAGKTKITCSMNNTLQPGNYLLSFGIHLENGATLEYLENYLKLEVLQVALNKHDDFVFNFKPGYVRIAATWMVEKDSAVIPVSVMK